MGAATSLQHVMRMRFELERDDNPPLLDELMKLPTAKKRLHRLRPLAQEGWHPQRRWSVPTVRGDARHEQTVGEPNAMCTQACRSPGASARRSHGVAKHPRQTY